MSYISQAFKGFTREGGFSSLSWEPSKKRVHCETFKGSRQDHGESDFNTGLSSSQELRSALLDPTDKDIWD